MEPLEELQTNVPENVLQNLICQSHHRESPLILHLRPDELREVPANERVGSVSIQGVEKKSKDNWQLR